MWLLSENQGDGGNYMLDEAHIHLGRELYAQNLS